MERPVRESQIAMRPAVAQASSMDITAANLDHLRNWTGRTEQRDDVVTAAPLAGWIAALDRADDPAPAEGTELCAAGALALLPAAGHATRDRRRRSPSTRRFPAAGGAAAAHVGGRTARLHHPLRVGDAVTRRSTIKSVDAKHGRSGALVFVTVLHEVLNAQGVAITEEHDIVYRDHPLPGSPPPPAAPAPTDEAYRRAIVPDPVLLFRYSALTFNGHRIHYDRSYVTEVEGYPGLIVARPADRHAARRPAASRAARRRAEAVRIQGGQPAVRHPPLHRLRQPEAGGGEVALWARNHQGQLAMTARAILG